CDDSFVKPGECFQIGWQRFIGPEGLEDEGCEVSRFEASAREHHDEIFRWPNVDSLAASPNRFEHTGIICAFHPPEITVAIIVARAIHVSACRCRNPGWRDNLVVAPASALEQQLSNLGHIAGMELEGTPTVVIAT